MFLPNGEIYNLDSTGSYSYTKRKENHLQLDKFNCQSPFYKSLSGHTVMRSDIWVFAKSKNILQRQKKMPMHKKNTAIVHVVTKQLVSREDKVLIDQVAAGRKHYHGSKN